MNYEIVFPLFRPRCVLEINQSIVATEFGSNRDPEVVDKIFSNMRRILCLPVHGYLHTRTHTRDSSAAVDLSSLSLCRMRGVGSAALNMCLVAAGCVEVYYEIGIHCWDIAAAAVIVEEAGGVLLDLSGKIITIKLSLQSMSKDPGIVARAAVLITALLCVSHCSDWVLDSVV